MKQIYGISEKGEIKGLGLPVQPGAQPEGQVQPEGDEQPEGQEQPEGDVQSERQRQHREQKRQETKAQRDRLREFDRELFSYTGQIAWLLPGLFSFLLLILMGIPVQEIEREDGALWWSVFMLVICNTFFVLQPYINITDTFERQSGRHNRTYDKLKYLPVSRRQYIAVRMGYLFRFTWKIALAGTVIQCIFAAVALGSVDFINVVYAAAALLLVPLAVGWLLLAFAG